MSSQVQASAQAPIVVAVNGSDGSLAAVRYAAKEAARVGCDLRLVHVALSYLPTMGLVPPTGSLDTAEVESIGQEILKASAEPAYDLLARDRVTTDLELGSRTVGVLAAAKGARQLVVGSDRAPLLERLMVGGFIGSVAAKSSVPVVTVPSDWTESTKPADERRVVLGLKDPQRIPFDLLRAGFQAAADLGALLKIAHVWELPAGYAALMRSIGEDRTWQTAIERSVRSLARPLRDEFPDVSYTAESWYGQPARILSGLARDAELLLLARRPHAFPFGHFGATGRALLREAPCPVEVLPVAERAPESTMSIHRTSAHRPEPEPAHS